MGIDWKQGPDLPTQSTGGQIVIRGIDVVYGGGTSEHVYYFDAEDEIWHTLPPLPVKWFALAGVGISNESILAAGGKIRGSNGVTNTVYSLHIPDSNEAETFESIQWSQDRVPPIPTARYSSSTINAEFGVIVIGGCIDNQTETNAVEIFVEKTSQWHTTDSLPIACHSVSIVGAVLQDRIYVLGGYKETSTLNQVFCASRKNLLKNSIEIDDDGFSPSMATPSESAWKELPNTRTYNPVACTLVDSLVVSGECDKTSNRRALLALSESTDSWIYVTDLPADVQQATLGNMMKTTVVLISGGSFFVGYLTVMENDVILKEDSGKFCTIL